MIIFVYVSTVTGQPVAQYWMDHDDGAQRRVLGAQCRNAFEAEQCVFTCPVPKFGELPSFLQEDR